HQHDRVLGDDAHQHQDADPHRRGELLAGQQQCGDRAADRKRQREQDGDRLQERSEQQHQHRIDHHQAGGDRGGKTFRQFVQAFGVARRAYLDALRQALHDRQFGNLLGGIAQRRRSDEVSRNRRLALAVVSVDAGRALVELDVGNDRERHAAFLAVLAERHTQLLERLQLAARGVFELDADRHQPVAGIEFGERRTDVADGGDADGLRQAFGGDAEPCREIRPWPDAQFGPVERGFRNHVGDDRNPLHLRRQLAGDVADDVAVGAGDDQRDRAQAVFVEKPEADIGNVLELVADLKLELALGDLATGLRRVIDDQRGAAYLERSRRNAAAVDEYASYFRPLAQARHDLLGDLLGVGKLRAGRQFHGEQRARGVLGRQETLRQQRDAPDRGRKDAKADQDR